MGKAIWDDPKNKAITEVFLTSPESDYINGVAIPLDGGKTIEP